MEHCWTPEVHNFYHLIMEQLAAHFWPVTSKTFLDLEQPTAYFQQAAWVQPPPLLGKEFNNRGSMPAYCSRQDFSAGGVSSRSFGLQDTVQTIKRLSLNRQRLCS